MENKKYLDKVIEHLVRRTKVDYDEEMLYTPFQKPLSIIQSIYLLVSFNTFYRHCEEIYGLNYDETEYVWEEYKEIIRVKINNGK
jgi:hypothetical protein